MSGKFGTKNSMIIVIVMLSGSVILPAFNPLYAIEPDFVTYSERTQRGIAMIKLTTLTEIPTNESVDMELDFLSRAGNSLISNGTVPYNFIVEQDGQIVYQMEGFSEDGVSVTSPEFSDGPAVITILLKGVRPDNGGDGDGAAGTFSQNLGSEIQGEENTVGITGTQQKRSSSQGVMDSSNINNNRLGITDRAVFHVVAGG